MIASPDGTVLRRRRPGAVGPDVETEAALLELVARVVRVPVPRVVDVPREGGCWLELERIAGVPLLEVATTVPARDRARIGGELGELIAELAAIPVAAVADLVPTEDPRPGELLAEAATFYRDIRGDLPRPIRTRVEVFLRETPDLVPADLVFAHQDLGAEHVFVQGSSHRVTGVIDWSDAAVGDPALDLGLILRDLGVPAMTSAMDRFVALRGSKPEGLLQRAFFHARLRTLEDLAHGLAEGLDTYRDNALRTMATLFPMIA